MDYPTTNTLRVKLFYNVGTQTHNMLFRFNSGIDVADALDSVTAFVNEAKAYFYGDVLFDRTDWYPEGETVAVPGREIGLDGTRSGERGVNEPGGFYVQFSGKSESAAQVGFYVFGLPFITRYNMRVAVTDNADIAGVRDALTGIDGIAAIDGNGITWRSYANLGINDFVTRKLRS